MTEGYSENNKIPQNVLKTITIVENDAKFEASSSWKAFIKRKWPRVETIPIIIKNLISSNKRGFQSIKSNKKLAKIVPVKAV